ncbi:MAG TPA: SagB/ThcOx family dehydrogenase [Chloroflexota bacterium]|nr:SagB/ThcOx family dehydrogenase [Chloroflexota bacterium]
MASQSRGGKGVLHKRLSVLLNIALLLVVLATFLSGFVGAALDLNRFAYHKYAAYAAIVLALAHVVLHWRALVGQIRRWLVHAPIPPMPRPSVRLPEGPLLSRRAMLLPPFWLAAGGVAGRWLLLPGSRPAFEEGDDLGQVYQQWSKPSYAGLLAKSLRLAPQPPLYKTYPGAPVMALPATDRSLDRPLAETIERRRSMREYASRPLTLAEVSQLLHYCGGITDRRDPTWAFRAAPSSGALYPIELYAAAFNVQGLAPGVYHYDVQRHALEQLRTGDVRQQAFSAALSQEMVLHASMMLVFTGMFSRVQWKYVDRSYRYMLLEAGHLGQNAYLTAGAMGLGVCGMGAFLDDDVNQLIGVDGKDEAAVYLMAIGALA